MAGESYFVPTDASGDQRVGDDLTTWSLPERLPDGTWRPGGHLEPETGAPVVLRDLDGLLDDLGERIFLAEPVGDGGSSARGARLVSETSWNLHEAARFALDCAEHVVVDPAALTLPSGATLGDVFSSAREYLAKGEAPSGGLVERMSRLALARRLRRLGDNVADLAFQITVEDEADDLEALDDPAWTATAAVRDAVLSATEAIRHQAFPRLFEGQNRRYEADSTVVDLPNETFSTPWGNFSAGNRAGVVPAWVAARDAAERARQAMADANGPDSGRREREWQRERLASALGLR
jgi:hypothetical protein